MYAIIKTGGKQYRVQEGDTVKVEKLAVEAGSEVVFDEVLAVSGGEKISIGTPNLKGVTVVATVLSQGKNDKIIVFKYKPKKGYAKKKGHRQPYTEVKIEKING
ncbi:MAG: 50S ribosomal protein L21 [Clostridiales bacterium GWE2_32_10]|nr:MAG: 50S ribosomal protein L21 [Clostridiales bacterium GWE2_32_10]HBY20453.1 50S ribosomal protein L21 [Clostridiales bacterium]